MGIPIAHYGLLDLSGWNFNQIEIVPLNGDWEFHWQELYSEDRKLTKSDPENPSHYIRIPGVWNDRIQGSETLSGEGFATLRLQVLLPSTEKDLAIVFPRNFYTVHAVWINGTKRSWNGVPGRTPETTDFQEHDIIESLVLESASVDLVIEIANFRGNTRWGGLRVPFYIGKASSVKTESVKNYFFSIFIFSCIFSIGIYHLSFFQNYAKDKLPLYFSVFCIIVSLYALTTSLVWIILFPKFTPNDLFRSEFILELLLTPTCYLFLQYIYPEEFSSKIKVLLITLVGFITVLILGLPIEVVSRFYVYSLYIPVVFGSYILAMIFKAYIKKRKFSGLMLTSTLFIFIFMLNDVMNGLINVLYFIPYSFPLGLLVFIAIQSHMISVRQAEAFRNAELLVTLQNKFNEHSRSRAEERSRIARDIHDSIGSEVTALMTYMQTDTDSPEQTIQKMRTQLAGILINIRDIVYLLGNDRKGTEILEGEIQKYLSRLEASKKFSIRSSIEPVSHRLGIEWSLNTQRIFLELMTNTIRHSKATEIQTHLKYNKHFVRLVVVNNGEPFSWNAKDHHPGNFGLEGILIRAQKMSARIRFFHIYNANIAILRIPCTI